MNELLTINIPVFLLLAIGYAAALFGLLDRRASEGLSEFVFSLATPALVLRTMTSATLPPSQPWGYWAAYFIGVAIVWAIGMWLAQRWHERSYGESVVAGFSSGQANTVLVGIPVILQAFGDAGAAPLFLLIAVHLPVTMTVATLLYEGRAGVHWFQIARRLALHPILLALFAGVLLRSFGVTPSGPVKMVIDGLGNAASPCALIAMGLALQQYGMRSSWRETLPVVALKLIVHPAIVYVLAFHVFDMPRVWAGVATLFAAMPTGVNAFLFAARYRVAEPLASSAIALSTALALITTLFWIWVVL
ncbi:MAG: transporter [Hyphomicrobiales bacterium]|nr:transporter [Hyphomicrobiales bacterium]